MSYALDVSPDTLADLRTLDLPLQEAFLDELDRLADDPARVPPPIDGFRSIHTFPVAHDGEEHLLIASVHVDHAGRMLSSLGVHHLPP